MTITTEVNEMTEEQARDELAALAKHDEPYAVVYGPGGDVLARVWGYTAEEARGLAQQRADAHNVKVTVDYGIGNHRVMFYDVAPAGTGLGICRYFLLCTNAADGLVAHPTIGNVPTCRRCADKLGLDLNTEGSK